MSFTLINPPENKGAIDKIVYTSLDKPAGSNATITSEYFHGLTYVPLFIAGYYDSVLQQSGDIPAFYLDQFTHLPFLFFNYTSDGAFGLYISVKADTQNITVYMDIPDNDPSGILNIDYHFAFIIVVLKEKMPSS